MNMEEFKLRRLIRKAIKIKEAKQRMLERQNLTEEQKLRKIVRAVLMEGDADSDTNPAPYPTTAMNILATALDEILPTLKTGLRRLKKPEERESYRAHVLEKMRNILNTVNSLGGPNLAAVKMGESDTGLLEQEDEDDIEVSIGSGKPPEMVVPDSEKQRFEPKKLSKEEEEEEKFKEFALSGQNPTGARIAFDTINSSNIQQNVVDNWKLLYDAADKKEFEEFLLYNTDLWLVTYENDIADEMGQEKAFSEPITPEPEKTELSARGQQAAQGTGGTPEAAASPEGDVDIDALMKDLPKV